MRLHSVPAKDEGQSRASTPIDLGRWQTHRNRRIPRAPLVDCLSLGAARTGFAAVAAIVVRQPAALTQQFLAIQLSFALGDYADLRSLPFLVELGRFEDSVQARKKTMVQ